MSKEKIKTTNIDQIVINLVIARLKTIPANASLSVGNMNNTIVNLSSTNLIQEVRNQSDIGKHIVESQLSFLRSLQDLPKPEDVVFNN